MQLPVSLRGRWSTPSPSSAWALALLSSAGIGAIDYLTGWELSFSIFYFVPVAIAAWSISRRAGLVISVVCAVIWFAADFTTHPRYSHVAIPFWNTAVRLGFLAMLSLVLSKMRASLDRQREMAQADPLTGMWNRRAFRARLQAELSRSRRYKRPLSVAYIDLDGFKAVNDRLGHHAGDELLVRVASLLRERVRVSDVVARLGGDEFAILFAETGAEEGHVAITKLLAETTTALKAQGLPVTLSVGLVTCQAAPEDEEGVMRMADRLMYSAKEAGGDRVRQELFEERSASELLEHV